MGRRKLSSLSLSKGDVGLDGDRAHKDARLARRTSKRQRRQIQLEEKVCMDDSVLDAVEGLRTHVDVKSHRNKLESMCQADDIEATEAQKLYQEMIQDGFRRVRVVRGNTERCVDEVQGDLCMHIPRNTYSLDGLESFLSGQQDIPTIDVNTQEEGPSMTFLQLKEYFSKPRRKRDRLLNIVSFNLGETDYGDYIVPPVAVRDLDLATCVWPTRNDEARPNTLTYLLMGPAGAYTDWHVDMGGSSVWYHIVSGCKIFLAAPPTKFNRQKFVEWSTTMSQSEFLGDKLRGLVRIKLQAGDTLFLPGGWFHAVSTPKDSIVVGGNFVCPLHYENILQVMEIEKKLKVKADFQYPQHQKLMYYAAGQLLGKIRKAQSSHQQFWCKGISEWEVQGLPYLIKYLERTLYRHGPQKASKDQPVEGDVEAIVEALKLQWQCINTSDIGAQNYNKNYESVERLPSSETPSSAATREAGYEEMAVDASVQMDKSLSSSQEPTKGAEPEKRKDEMRMTQKPKENKSQDGSLAATLREIATPPLKKYNVDEEDLKTISEIKQILAKTTKLNASCSPDLISDGDESSLKRVEEADAPASPEEESLPVAPPEKPGSAEPVVAHQVEDQKMPQSPVIRKSKHGLKPKDMRKGGFLREKPSAEPTAAEKTRLEALQRYATSQALQPLSRQGSKKMDLCSEKKASTQNIRAEDSWHDEVTKLLKELKLISRTAKKELIILDNVKHGRMKLSDNGARIKQKMNELIVTWRGKANTLHSILQEYNKDSEVDTILHDETEKELVTMDDVMVRCQSACGVSPGTHQRLVLSPRRSPGRRKYVHNHHDKTNSRQNETQPRTHSNTLHDKDKSRHHVEKPGAARSLKPLIDSARDIETLASWYLGDSYLGPYSKSDLRAMVVRGETTLFTFVHSHDGTVTMSLKSLLGPGTESQRAARDPSQGTSALERSAKLQAPSTFLEKTCNLSTKQVQDKKNSLSHSDQGKTWNLSVPSANANNVSRTPSPIESFIPVGNAPDCVDQNNQTESDEGGSETFSLAADKKPGNLTAATLQQHPHVQNRDQQAYPNKGILFNYRDAAIAVLTAQNQFMTPHEIVDEALRLNMIVPKGKTPAATMASRLLYDTKKPENIFVSDSTGKFGLKAWLA